MAYLRLAKDSKYSFILESVIAGENIARYSFVGAGESIPPNNTDPFKVIRSGPGHEVIGDPMAALQRELRAYKYVKIPEVPTFT
ncbi:hypothetical protein FRC11_003114, partial [Ceratobasidium sp. 423]